MTKVTEHLIKKLDFAHWSLDEVKAINALRSVLEYHSPREIVTHARIIEDNEVRYEEHVSLECGCGLRYPCETVKRAEKELL